MRIYKTVKYFLTKRYILGNYFKLSALFRKLLIKVNDIKLKHRIFGEDCTFIFCLKCHAETGIKNYFDIDILLRKCTFF